MFLADCEARAEDTNHLKKRGSIVESTTERVGIRELLEAGVHFGHQAKRWNPKMKRYIFAERAGVHIIDLDQTLTLLDRALDFVRSVAEAEREVLFVGTKKQAQIPMAEQALRSGQPYIAERYIGGILTNFQTILPRIQYFKDLARRVEETPEEERTGKDWFALNREYQKLRRNFAGITEVERLPGAVFVIDPKREELLVKEANRLKIPVVALTDTNCDPEVVDYVIPGNDDAIRSISLLARLIADAVVEGRGEEAIPAEGRLVPPVVEEAQVSEEVSEEVSLEVSVGAADGLPEGSETEEAHAEEAAPVDEEEAQLPDAPSPEARDGEPEEAEAEEAEPEEAEAEQVEEAEAPTDEEPEAEAATDAEASDPEAAAGPEAGEPEGESLDEGDEAPEDSEETEEK
jgi:small subunit ribosomal protein S2